MSSAGPPTWRVPTAAAFRPQVFSTSRRFAPRVASRACFIPLARPGFPLQGLSLPRSRAASQRPLPSCRCRRPSSRRRRTVGPSSGPCSPRESVLHGRAVHPTADRCPPGVHPLQGPPSLGRGSRLRDPPLSSLGRFRTRRARACSPGSSLPRARLASREAADPPEVPDLVEPLSRSRARPDLAYRFTSGPTPRHRAPGGPLRSVPASASAGRELVSVTSLRRSLSRRLVTSS
jgi:hypothetical protein